MINCSQFEMEEEIKALHFSFKGHVT